MRFQSPKTLGVLLPLSLLLAACSAEPEAAVDEEAGAQDTPLIGTCSAGYSSAVGMGPTKKAAKRAAAELANSLCASAGSCAVGECSAIADGCSLNADGSFSCGACSTCMRVIYLDTTAYTEHHAGDWASIVSCLSNDYARWRVVLTEVDPGPDVQHVHAMFGGTSPVGALGLGPKTCQPAEDGEAFIYTDTHVFANDPTSYYDATTLCNAAAQEIAHAYTLDHEMNCYDPMTYLPACQAPLAFQDTSSNCGEFSPRDCICNRGPMQNSVALLNQVLGTR